jgi:hypothetical protein
VNCGSDLGVKRATPLGRSKVAPIDHAPPYAVAVGDESDKNVIRKSVSSNSYTAQSLSSDGGSNEAKSLVSCCLPKADSCSLDTEDSNLRTRLVHLPYQEFPIPRTPKKPSQANEAERPHSPPSYECA